MAKTKRKTPPQTFWQYIWNDLLLFRRDFVLVSDLSPDECVTALQDHTIQRAGTWRGQRLNVEKLNDNTQHRFKIQAAHPALKRPTAEVTIANDARGTIIQGKAIVTGYRGSLLWVILMAVLSLTLRKEPGLACMWLFLGFFVTFLWLNARTNRNYLIRIIEQAVSGEKGKHE